MADVETVAGSPVPSHRPGLRLAPWLSQPWRDFGSGFDGALGSQGRNLVFMLLGLVVGWWVYVPLHELLHALACVLFGGSVGKLEIANLYGGDLYAALFPFVVAGGEYAGRLAEFETGGSDWVYLATDLGPYVLTLFPGVWAWRRSALAKRAFGFGFWLPFALAPFISLTGDAYEIGSLAVSQLAPWQGAVGLVGDDLFRVREVLAAQASPPWGGYLLAAFTGLVWSFVTYGLAARLADLLAAPSPSQATAAQATAEQGAAEQGAEPETPETKVGGR